MIRPENGGGDGSAPLGKPRALADEMRVGAAMCWDGRSYDGRHSTDVRRVRRRLLKSAAASACCQGAKRRLPGRMQPQTRFKRVDGVEITSA